MDSFMDLMGRGFLVSCIALGILWHFAKKFAANNPDVAEKGKTLAAQKAKSLLDKYLK